MEPIVIVAICALLGAIGGLFHWLMPDPQGISRDDSIRRVIIGLVAGVLFGSPGMLGAWAMDNTTVVGMTALMGAAIATMAEGYVGVDLAAMVKNRKAASSPAPAEQKKDG
jgi:hypothetical protein